jgi:hypothetical protein
MDAETHVLVELYNALEREPSSVYVHERLLEVWQELGDESNEALLHPPCRDLWVVADGI